jgi:hypothetical protein
MNSEKKLGPLDADPNLVPFQEAWRDNTGGMANAIFWLDKHWDKQLNAQGNYTDEHGRMIFWNYSWSMKSLLVHVNGSREHWRVDREKILHMKDGIEENATIYRPFFRTQPYGTSMYRDGAPDVEWLKTREVVVVKNHHTDRLPLYRSVACTQLSTLLNNKPFQQFPHVRLGELVMAPLPKERQWDRYEPMSPEQALAYADALEMTQLLSKSVMHEFQTHHIPSYFAFEGAVRKFNATISEEWAVKSHVEKALFDEMIRLVNIGRPRDAAIVDAMLFHREYVLREDQGDGGSQGW